MPILSDTTTSKPELKPQPSRSKLKDTRYRDLLKYSILKSASFRGWKRDIAWSYLEENACLRVLDRAKLGFPGTITNTTAELNYLSCGVYWPMKTITHSRLSNTTVYLWWPDFFISTKSDVTRWINVIVSCSNTLGTFISITGKVTEAARAWTLSSSSTAWNGTASVQTWPRRSRTSGTRRVSPTSHCTAKVSFSVHTISLK